MSIIIVLLCYHIIVLLLLIDLMIIISNSIIIIILLLVLYISRLWSCGRSPLTAAGKGLANFSTYSASASAWLSFPLKMICTAPWRDGEKPVTEDAALNANQIRAGLYILHVVFFFPAVMLTKRLFELSCECRGSRSLSIRRDQVQVVSYAN